MWRWSGGRIRTIIITTRIITTIIRAEEEEEVPAASAGEKERKRIREGRGVADGGGRGDD